MPQQSLEIILVRAISDATFADTLFANPDSALSGFDLTAEEIALIKSMSRAELDKFKDATPEERKAFVLSGAYPE